VSELQNYDQFGTSFRTYYLNIKLLSPFRTIYQIFSKSFQYYFFLNSEVNLGYIHDPKIHASNFCETKMFAKLKSTQEIF